MKTGYMQEFTEHKDIATERGGEKKGSEGKEGEREKRKRESQETETGTPQI